MMSLVIAFFRTKLPRCRCFMWSPLAFIVALLSDIGRAGESILGYSRLRLPQVGYM